MNDKKIAVIIPAYNEAQTILQVVGDFRVAVPQATVYVIDNNSSDKTAELVESIVQNNPGLVLLHEKRQGKSEAIRFAFQHVDADVYVMVDADSTYHASDLPELLRPVLENEADVVVGNRFGRGDYQATNERRFHSFGNTMVKRLINMLFKSSVQDILSGYRVFSRTFVKTFPIIGSGFTLETEMTLHTLDKGYRMLEVPVSYSNRPSGSESKLNTLADGIRVVGTVLNIYRLFRPLPFFSFIGFVLVLFGLLSGVAPVADYILYKDVVHIPLAILASGLVISALLVFSAGLILDGVMNTNKRIFFLHILAQKKG
ncbi:MAG: glycosyltransferase family 2 protein [Kiritimatiellales bacterium]|nr:glycosyltransferase family 2 protein [Kiritimatiellales bacterium]